MVARVNLTQESVRNSPRDDPTLPVNKEYEIRLYDYYLGIASAGFATLTSFPAS
jgi:hypothetical protein